MKTQNLKYARRRRLIIVAERFRSALAVSVLTGSSYRTVAFNLN